MLGVRLVSVVSLVLTCHCEGGGRGGDPPIDLGTVFLWYTDSSELCQLPLFDLIQFTTPAHTPHTPRGS